MWLAACCMLLFWLGVDGTNYLVSEEFEIEIDPSDLEPLMQPLKDIHHSTAVPAIVLTLDVSASMEYRNRIKNLSSALHQWIYSIPDGLLLGMVKFSTEEELLSELTPVHVTTRAQLVHSIPTRGQGETCIGCGVRLALQLLGSRNGVIVLVTDGQNTEPGQFISDVQDEVVAAGPKVVAVGFGDIAPLNDLKQLANVTGGLFFFVSDDDSTQGLLAALEKSLELAQAQQLEDPTVLVTFENSTPQEYEEHTGYSVTTATNSATLSPHWKTGVNNRTTSHSSGGKQRRIFAPWLVLGIISAVVGGLMLLVLLVFLIWRRFHITQVIGFYPVAQSEVHNINT